MEAAGTKTGAMASFKKSFEGLKSTSHSAAKGVTDTAGTDRWLQGDTIDIRPGIKRVVLQLIQHFIFLSKRFCSKMKFKSCQSL